MSEALLAVRDLEAFYGDFQALFGVSIDVARGEAVAVIGANGAGKSTLLKSIAGLLRARTDAITFAG
jgi:branched-chain amino acid transport system ATP-binding protein